MREDDIIKTNENWNSYYETYKAKFVKSTDLPLFKKDNAEEMIIKNFYSKSRAKKENVNISDEISGFYRVKNGYIPLFRCKGEY